MNAKVTLIKANYKNQPAKQHTKMNKENYRKIKKHLEGRLHTATDANNPDRNLKTLALYFAVVTGSRPNEAAHVVYNKHIYTNDKPTNERWGVIDYAATMDKGSTKTGVDYVWLIPSKRNWFVDKVKAADISAFKVDYVLADSLRKWFDKMRDEAGIPKVVDKDGKKGAHNMRSVRCYKATRWVQACAEYKAMGWPWPPPNPLQHTTPHLAKKTYAEEGADDLAAALLRLIGSKDKEVAKEAGELVDK